MVPTPLILNLFVPGVPRSKGSMRAFLPKGSRRPVLTSTSGSGLKDWERAIRHEAAQHGVFFDGAVRVGLTFFLPRPKSLPKRVLDMTKKPDLDKLVRAVLDALTKIVWQDDAAVTSIFAVKYYAGPGQIPGVHIGITENGL